MNRDLLSVVAAVALMLVSVALGLYQGGALAWLGAGLGSLFVAKSILIPSARDRLAVGVVWGIWLLAWPAIFFYVVSVWEQGEVVELSIQAGEKTHSVRTWVMDDEESPVVFYDAPGSVVQDWIDAERIQVKRGAETSAFRPSTVLASELPEADVERVTALVEQKYGALGRTPDRVTLVIWLMPESDS